MGLLRSRSRLPAVAVIVAAALALAACSGSGSSTGSGGSSSSTGSTSSKSTATTSDTNSTTRPATRYNSARATVIGTSTTVIVNPALSAILKHADVTVMAVAPATAKARLHFPISGGQVVRATLAGSIEHNGALAFRHSGRSVRLTNLVINLNTKRLTAIVGGQSLPVFALNRASLKRGLHGTVIANDIRLTMTFQAATDLNNRLGVSTFKRGMNFGTAKLTVAYARGRRGHLSR